MIKDTTIEKFRSLMAEHGQDLSKKEAREVVTGLVGYFDLLAKIYHQMKTDKDSQENNSK